MPEGIIRDPKQNKSEKLYGIVYIPSLRGCFQYRKKRNDVSRYLVAGSIVEVKTNNVDFYSDPLVIDGMLVLGKINNPDIEDKTDEKAGPVTKWLKSNGASSLNEEKMDELIGDDTELPSKEKK
jgi:hypothetical protein